MTAAARLEDAPVTPAGASLDGENGPPTSGATSVQATIEKSPQSGGEDGSAARRYGTVNSLARPSYPELQTVAVIDDDDACLRATVKMLKQRGIEAHAFSRQPHPDDYGNLDIDAVLTDWEPFGAEVVEFCEANAIPVAVYTGNGDEPRKFNDLFVVDKPAKTDALIAALLAAVAQTKELTKEEHEDARQEAQWEMSDDR